MILGRDTAFGQTADCQIADDVAGIRSGIFAAGAGIEDVSQGQFWLVLWSVALWFVLQRLIMVWAFCKYYKVKPMGKDSLPSLKQTLRVGWQAMLLPVIILLPFVLDAVFADNFFVARLGAEGAKYLSKSVLLFVPGIAALYACCIATCFFSCIGVPGSVKRLPSYSVET